jgi:PHP family Zn ribbon phosphoesterase
MEAFNARAMENYRSHGMAECDNCGRKFFFEQIEKHRKNCELINGKLNKGQSKPVQEQRPLKIVKPKMITCIVCGR